MKFKRWLPPTSQYQPIRQRKMAGITKEDLRREITAIFKDADLSSMSAKKLRQQLEKKLDVDLSDRKKEVDEIMMECLEQKRDGKSPKESKKRKDAADDDEEEEEEEEEEDEEEKKGKRTAAKKKPPPKKQKKGSSDESDEGSDDNASDEEYNPGGKKGKGGGAKKGGKGKKKAKGSDSDEGSDEDWAKSRRGGGGGGNSTPAKKGPAAKRGGGGGGYTKALNLTPELAALVGCESMARHEVVKKIWAIIKGRNLFDPKNKQFAICDDELLKVFGVKRFRTFGMMKYLKNHFID
ncbi:hypothetical protein J437_LFUL010816 [Ladona fulva]|uniref:Upstream activation factor subunit spp27 n=1 Tax=Ladona fulva TaxID=123851 RepID=A0A8K0KBJ7_LADFU|nr:hypothetical protein J437_LFUL010816 [Ladona fulva]